MHLQIREIPFSTRAPQQTRGEGFLGAEGSDLPSSPLKRLPAMGKGLSLSSGSTGDPQGSPGPTCSQCPVTDFSPSPAHQCWVPAHPDALNQQEKNPTSGFKERARDRFLYAGLCSEPRWHAVGSPALLRLGRHGPDCKDAAQNWMRSFNGKKQKEARAASPEPLAKCFPSMRPPPGTLLPASPETSLPAKASLRTPGSAGLRQPGEVDAEQGKVPAAGTTA